MPTKLFDLKGKIALISGASRGIGEFAARLLAEQGAHVIVSNSQPFNQSRGTPRFVALSCVR